MFTPSSSLPEQGQHTCPANARIKKSKGTKTSRSTLWVAALALLASTTLVGCGGGGSGSDSAPAANAGGNVQALAVSAPGELTKWAQDKLRARSAAGGDFSSPGLAVEFMGGPVFTVTAAGSVAGARSGTLVQEAGVDEADLLLSSGQRLFTLQPDDSGVGLQLDLQVYNRGANGVAQPAAQLKLSQGQPDAMSSSNGMYLNADKSAMAVVTQNWLVGTDLACQGSCGIAPPTTGASTTMPALLHGTVGVQRVAVPESGQPTVTQRLDIDGQLVDSRQVGNTLYVVSSFDPRPPVFQLPADANAAEREAAIAKTSTADLLPRLRINNGQPQTLVNDTDCYVQTANATQDLRVTTITAVDLSSASLASTSRCIVGGTEALYMSTSSLYLATTRNAYENTPMGDGLLFARYPVDMRTDIHKFALGGTVGASSISYHGSGTVKGHLGWDQQRKSFRLSEHAGDLRVLTFTGETGWFGVQDIDDSSKPASPATLSILRERTSDQTLQAVSTLPNNSRPAAIGKPGEQVYGVRFLGDRAYVVTFRRTDPMYVLDLSDPADPKTAGALEIAGFSEHLFPLDNGLLLGVGRAADDQGRVTGLKVALFDVANPNAPRELAEKLLGGQGSEMTLDYSRHGLNYLVKNNVARLAMPVILTASTPKGARVAGLQRFEVDLQTRGLRDLPMKGAVQPTDAPDVPYRQLWLDRSLQIDDQIYFLEQGKLNTYAW